MRGAVVHASACTVTTESTASISRLDASVGEPPDHKESLRHTPLPPTQCTMKRGEGGGGDVSASTNWLILYLAVSPVSKTRP